MKIRKLIRDSFYVNSTSLSGTTLTRLLANLPYAWIFYTDKYSDKWKLSGATAATASGNVLVDSNTTSITLSPLTFTGETGTTYQISVLNQNGENVITECTFSGTTGNTVTSGGLITLGPAVGTGQVTTYQIDPVTFVTLTGTTQTLAWNVTGLTFRISGATAITGTTTGQTFPSTVTQQTGVNVIAGCTFSSGTVTVATVNATTGLVTMVGNHGSSIITATYKNGVTATATVNF